MTATPLDTLSPQLAEPPLQLKLKARKGWQPIQFGELWHYRELLWILAQRDIKVRYKQSVLGILWAIIPPVFNTLVFNFIFVIVLKIDAKNISNGIPYPIFVYIGMVPWQLFASSLSQMGNSMVGSQGLITKVYFPRLIIPLSSIISCLVDFAIAMVILVGMMIWYHRDINIGWPIFTFPLFTLLAILSAMSVGLWLAALNVEYRDIRFVIPVMIQLWMYGSPVMYASLKVPSQVRWLYSLNPMVGVLNGFRWSLLGRGEAPGLMLICQVLLVAALAAGGLFYFRRMERTFADLV